ADVLQPGHRRQPRQAGGTDSPRQPRQPRQVTAEEIGEGGRRRTGIVLAALAAAMIVSTLVSIRYGALDFSWREMASSTAALLSGRSGATLEERIFSELRVP